ncbi:hypothetical protein K439DRAFT_1307112, partial [Ramaria rubella]
VITFVDLTWHLCKHIIWNQPELVTDPPIGLPISIHGFICDALGVDDQITSLLWVALKNMVW